MPDNGTISFKTDVKNAGSRSSPITIKKDGKKVAEASGKSDEKVTVKIENPVLWSPEESYSCMMFQLN